MMDNRSRAREVALQVLFEADLNKTPMSSAAAKAFIAQRLINNRAMIEFCHTLIDGTRKNKASIDQTIVATAINWRLVRMMPADRNIMRLASYELLHSPVNEPVQIVLNEAIELAKRFGSADSASFVNGILDKIAKLRPAIVVAPE